MKIFVLGFCLGQAVAVTACLSIGGMPADASIFFGFMWPIVAIIGTGLKLFGLI